MSGRMARKLRKALKNQGHFKVEAEYGISVDKKKIINKSKLLYRRLKKMYTRDEGL